MADAYKDQVAKYRHELIEAAVEHDNQLLEKYLGGAELTEAEIHQAIRNATIHHGLVPVLCGASFKNKGVQALLDAVIDYLPCPDRREGDPGPPAAARHDSRRASPGG